MLHCSWMKWCCCRGNSNWKPFGKGIDVSLLVGAQQFLFLCFFFSSPPLYCSMSECSHDCPSILSSTYQPLFCSHLDYFLCTSVHRGKNENTHRALHKVQPAQLIINVHRYLLSQSHGAGLLATFSFAAMIKAIHLMTTTYFLQCLL